MERLWTRIATGTPTTFIPCEWLKPPGERMVPLGIGPDGGFSLIDRWRWPIDRGKRRARPGIRARQS